MNCNCACEDLNVDQDYYDSGASVVQSAVKPKNNQSGNEIYDASEFKVVEVD